MQVGHFPAAAANSLIEGYCDDFVSLAAILAQTLEQVSMRGLDIRNSRGALERIERGMRDLADAIRELLDRGQVKPELTALIRSGEQPLHGAGAARQGAAPPPTAPAPQDPPATSFLQTTHALPATSQQPAAAPHRGRTPGAAGPLSFEQQPPAAAPAAAEPGAPGKRKGLTFDPFAEPRPPQSPGNHPGAGASEARRPAARSDAAAPAASKPPIRSAVQQPSQSAEGLRGTSQSMPLLSVFQFLGRMRKNGVMTVRVNDEVLTFGFANGSVQSATSNKNPANERIGEILVETGACRREDMVALLANSQGRTANQLGELVIRQGLATTGQILEALELQVRRRFTRACEAPNATYEFNDCAPAASDGRIRISPSELAHDPNRKPGT